MPDTIRAIRITGPGTPEDLNASEVAVPAAMHHGQWQVADDHRSLSAGETSGKHVVVDVRR